MTKENVWNPMVVLAMLLGLLMVFGFLMLGLIAWGNHNTNTATCDRYADYGYVVYLEGFPDYHCYILMQDGTKVYSDDFDVSDFKHPYLEDMSGFNESYSCGRMVSVYQEAMTECLTRILLCQGGLS